MPFMHLQVKKPQNDTINVFTQKQATTNVPLIFLNEKILKELHQRCFEALRGKVQRLYLAFKNLRIKRKQGNQSTKKQETSMTDAFGV